MIANQELRSWFTQEVLPLERDLDAAAVGRVLHGIHDHVLEDATQIIAIASDQDRLVG